MLTNSAANTACGDHYLTELCAGTSAPAGRFFVWSGLLLCLLFPPPGKPDAAANQPDPASCRTSNYDEKAAVKSVIDGDTIILADERHIRLIGINTPEIGHDGRPTQPGADQAYNYLNSLLRTNKTVRLHYDRERADHYGRTLAHLFLPDGTNIQSLLLIRGLATTLTIPPNLEFMDCYAASAEDAQSSRIGLWALKQYQPIPVELITIRELGYRIVTGKIIRIAEGKSSLWLGLAKNLSVRIDNEDLKYFNKVRELEGSQVMVSGFLYFSNGEFRMHIRHPADLKITNTANVN